MVDLGPVLTAATEYGDAREAEGRAAAEVEAAERIAELNATLISTRAERDEAQAVVGGLIDALDTLRAEFDAYKLAHPEPAPDPEPEPEPEPEPAALKSIGMSSPKTLWDQRLNEVGPQGITAQRIFSQLGTGGTLTNFDRIQDAITNGRTPLVSFKFPSITEAGRGAYDQWVEQAADRLNALGSRVLVASWHEASDDMTPDQFMAIQRRHIPILNARANLETFNINHGWLLDRQVDEFAQYLPLELVDLVDYAGIDTYQSGTLTAPGDAEPHHRIAAFVDYLTDIGRPDKPIVIGEYNGYTAGAVQRAGEAILSTPNVRYACVFNSATGGKGETLTGDRLAAFRETKADPRVKQ